VFVFELTRDYEVIVPLMLATVIADLVFNAVSDHSIMTEKLSHRGLRIGRHYGVDPFTTVPVEQIMTAPVATISSSATVDEARSLFLSGGHGAYPVVDARGEVVGIVTRGDVLDDGAAGTAPVLDHASRDVVAVSPSEMATAALHVMIDEKVEHVPVLRDGLLVGICTRTDLLKVRDSQRTLEQRQAGLLTTALRQRRS
jgi:CIC family chloride channel protein